MSKWYKYRPLFVGSGLPPELRRKHFRMTGDQLYQVLLTLLPSIVVFLTAYYLLRQRPGSRNSAENNQIMAEAKREDRKQTLPLRLQAYERLTLFLEPIDRGPCLPSPQEQHDRTDAACGAFGHGSRGI